MGSCTAQAAVGLIEFYERKAFGTHIDASRLFLYKATRNLLGWTGIGSTDGQGIAGLVCLAMGLMLLGEEKPRNA